MGVVLVFGAPARAAPPAGDATPAQPPHVGYWASAGLDVLAARAVHPYLRVDGGLPITSAISLQVSVLVAEGVRDFYDWRRPDYDWAAAAIVPGVLIEKTVYEVDGHVVTVGGDAGFGVHVLQADLPADGPTMTVAGLGRASAVVRFVANNGVLVQLAPLGVGILVEPEQLHAWYEGSLMFGFRWP